MENRKITMKCYKCGKQYTTDQMRYDPEKQGILVCKGCLTKKPTTAQSSFKPKEGEKSVKYYCIKCNYRFERRKGVDVPACPYCGRSDTITTKTDAESILKDTDELV